jgi:predicted phage tail protein
VRTVYLHGHLGERFGASFRLDVDTPQEAARALAVQLPGFSQVIRAGNWHIVRGPLEGRDEVDEKSLEVTLGTYGEIHFIPAIEGANSGWVSTIVGAVLVVAGVMTGNAALVGMGVGMTVGGIIQLTTAMPGVDMDEMQGVDERASYLFNGPSNRSKQGGAVPRGYGRLKVGSIVISAGLFAEEVPL